MDFDFTLWTKDPSLAKRADRAGIHRIGPDLEWIGKKTRQAGYDTWHSPHRESDLPGVRKSLTRASLFCRCNPYGEHTPNEIGRLLEMGVQIIMLPNIQDVSEVKSVCSLVNGRAQLIPLIERYRAVLQVDEILRVDGIEEIHIGLNDLAIDLEYRNRLAVLVDPAIKILADKVKKAGVKLGMGGIARAMDDGLPIPSDLVYAQLMYLGATGALISRSFSARNMDDDELHLQISLAKKRLEYWSNLSEVELKRGSVQLEALSQFMEEAK